jgi:WhiB family transcriptional regulator, redox-sensing transcriptional regulator
MIGIVEGYEAGVAANQQRMLRHQIVAHRMAERGQSHEVIADHLRVSTRSVQRYLAVPCPQPPPPVDEVSLKDFYLDGACSEFPELDWNSRSLTERAECKAVCTYCPVLAKCRTYGMTTGLQDVGIWGALTKEERKREATQKRRAAARRAPGGIERGVA